MKLALISDMHGNAIAFEAVLEQLDRQDISQIICLGDAIATGPQPAKCLELLRERRIPTIMGNADEWLLDPEQDPEASEFHRFIEDIDLWCRDQLTDNDLAFIQRFQPTIEVKLSDAHGLLAFHGSPRSNTETINATTPDETLAELHPDSNISIMAGGHAHQPLLRRYRDLLLINPGSIGLGYERNRATGEPYNIGWAEYAIIEVNPTQPNEQGNLDIHFRRTTYSVDALRQAAQSSGMPQAKRWSDGWMV